MKLFFLWLTTSLAAANGSPVSWPKCKPLESTPAFQKIKRLGDELQSRDRSLASAYQQSPGMFSTQQMRISWCQIRVTDLNGIHPVISTLGAEVRSVVMGARELNMGECAQEAAASEGKLVEVYNRHTGTHRQKCSGR